MKFRSPPVSLALAFLFAVPAVRAEFAVAPVFGDHMVLQQKMPVPIWGTADPGKTVHVTFAGATATTTAGPDGAWRVRLGPLAASATPGTLTARTDDPSPTVEIHDVLVGEVWIGSGQSNMQIWAETFLGGAKSSDPGIAANPGDKNLRALLDAAPYPLVRLLNASNGNNPIRPDELRWLPATRDNLLHFSAQLQSMGVPLSRELNVPVGLITAAIGGSPSGRWITPEALAADPGCRAAIEKANAKFSLEKEQAAYAAALKKFETDVAAWNQLSDAAKKTTKAPGKPNPPVRPGEGQRWAVGDLHAQVLSPLIGYGIRGILWDQGESGTLTRALDQDTLLPALVASWRKEWGQGDFPWIYVQKPSGGGCAFDPTDKIYGWASDPFLPLPAAVPGNGENRDSYQRLAAIPHAYMVPTSDLGSGLHPWNKFGYGSRARQIILAAVYGRPGAPSGPQFASAAVEGHGIRVHFKNSGGGLVFRQGDHLQGFAVAGADKRFVWGDASIDGDAVLVSSPQVPAPVYVRYAWADRPQWANLFSKQGLPAESFRTDP